MSSGSGGPGPGQYDPFKEPGIRAPIDLVNIFSKLEWLLVSDLNLKMFGLIDLSFIELKVKEMLF